MAGVSNEELHPAVSATPALDPAAESAMLFEEQTPAPSRPKLSRKFDNEFDIEKNILYTCFSLHSNNCFEHYSEN